MTDFGPTPLSTRALGSNQFPVSAVFVPGTSLGTLTALEGIAINTDGSGYQSSAVRVGLKDGDDVTQGSTTDSAVTGDTSGTISAKLRGINKILATLSFDGSNFLKVNVAAGTLTANIGTTNGLALDATVGKLTVAQGASLGSNTGPMVQGSVTTAAPSYTTGQISPLSLTLAGALRVDASATTQPVSGTVSITANSSVNVAQVSGTTADTNTGNASAGTQRVVLASNQPAIATSQSGTWTVQQGGAPWSDNLTQVGGSAIALGSKTSANSFPVVIASDQAAISVQHGNAVDAGNSSTSALTANSVFTGTGTSSLNYSAISVEVFADQASASGGLSIQQSQDNTNWDIKDTFSVSASTTFNTVVNLVGQYYRVVYTNGTTGQGTFRLQTVKSVADPVNPRTLSALGNFKVAVQEPLPAGANTIGSVTQASGPWTSNITQVGGSAISLGSKASANSFPVVVASDQGAIPASQSGTWTVQPGNTANTTPWLATINQGGNSATVTSSNALKVDGSAVTQPISGAVTANIGTTNGLALDATVGKLTVAQGASLGSNTGPMVQGSVTTAAPSYTTGQISPISLTTAGALRVDGSAVTQPVSGTFWQATQPVSIASLPALPANQSVNIAQVAGGNTSSAGQTGAIQVGGAVATNTAVSSATNPLLIAGSDYGGTPKVQSLKVDSSGNAQVAITNTPTVTANAGTGNFNNASVGSTGSGVPNSASYIGGNKSGNLAGLSLDSSGNLNVNVAAGSSGNAAASATGSSVPADADYTGINVSGTLRGQTGVNPIGAVYAGQVDIASIAGSTLATAATGIMKVGLTDGSGNAINSTSNALDVSVQNSTLAVTESGTWTVQPGNTQNTTAWLTQDAADGPAQPGSAAAKSILGGLVFNSAAPAPTSGQQMAAQADQAGNLRIFPGIALTTLSAWNSGTGSNATQTIFSNSGAPAVLIQLDQTTTITGGAITFEANYDGTNWVSPPANTILDPTSSSYAQLANPYTLQASMNKPLLIISNGWQALRIRLSTVISGTGAVTPYYALLAFNPVPQSIVYSPTAANFQVAVGAALPAGANTIGAVTIQATSGTALSADQSGSILKTSLYVKKSANADTVLALGSATSANSVPVVIASDQGSFSVTANIGTTNGLALDTSVNGLLLSQGSTTVGQKGPLVQGAVTTGSPSYTTAQTSPLSLTTAGALRVDASATTQPVSGTVTANQGGSNWSTNLAQIGGTTVVTGGASGLLAVAGPVASGSSNADNPLKIGGAFNSTQPTVTTGQVVDAQMTARGAQIVATGVDTFNVTVNAALPTGSNTIGAVTQASGPWTSNVTQFGGNNVATGTGASGTGIPRVTVSNDSEVQIWDGTNGPVAVKAANTPPTLADKSHVHSISPNNSGLPVNLPVPYVQKASNVSSGSVASLAKAFTSNNAAGNSIVVACAVGNGTAPTISDTNSNTYTQVAQIANGTALNVAVFLSVGAPSGGITAGANTVTINNGGSTASIAMEIYEVPGLLTQATAQPDQTATNTGSSGTASTASINATTPNELAFAAIGVGTAAQTITAGSGWTNDSGQQNPTTPAGLFSFVSMSQFLSSLKAVTPQATFTSEPWAIAVASFRPVLLGVGAAVTGVAANLTQTNQVPVSNAGQQGQLTISGSLTANSDNSLTFSGNSTVARRIRIQNESAGVIYWSLDATASAGSPSIASPASNAVSVEWINMACTTLHIFIPSGGTTTLNGSGGVKVSAWA